MSSEIIPFGKYKGQPLEILKEDRQYTEWIMSQDWFVKRYSHLHTIIINNFHQPQDTPEHNQLMTKFLNDDFCFSLLKKYNPDFFEPFSDQLLWSDVAYKGLDISYKSYQLPIRQVFKKKQPVKAEKGEYLLKVEKKFETKRGADLMLDFSAMQSYTVPLLQFTPLFLYNREELSDRIEIHLLDTCRLIIEVKPFISDDFPTIMKQCRDQHSNVLVINEYTGVGASLDDVREMFPDITIMTFNEIEKEGYGN